MIVDGKMMIVDEWIAAKAKMDHYKKIEAKLRKDIVLEFFSDCSEGTQDLVIEGYQLKAGIKLNRTIDTSELETLEHLFSEEEASCITRKPSLSMTAYRKLDEHERTTLDMCITTKPAMPTLKAEFIEE